MMKNLVFLLLGFYVFSCSLSADQEQALNRDMSAYITARNQGASVTFVARTYPSAVRFYRSKSETDFIKHYSLKGIDTLPEWYNPVLRSVKDEGESLQAKYWFNNRTKHTMNSSVRDSVHFDIYALTEDGGENWFFLPSADYFNDSILPPSNRFFKME